MLHSKSLFHRSPNHIQLSQNLLDRSHNHSHSHQFQPIVLASAGQQLEPTAAVPRGKIVTKCGLCRQLGHDKSKVLIELSQVHLLHTSQEKEDAPTSINSHNTCYSSSAIIIRNWRCEH